MNKGAHRPGDCSERVWDAVCKSPSVFGRLAAVAALRSRESGVYRHKLAEELGADPVDQALRQMHRELFRSWLGLRLEQQERDLSIWLTWLDRGGQDSAQRLRQVSGRPADLVPPQQADADRHLFLNDFRLVVSLLEQADSDTKAPEEPAGRQPSRLRRLINAVVRRGG